MQEKALPVLYEGYVPVAVGMDLPLMRVHHGRLLQLVERLARDVRQCGFESHVDHSDNPL